MGKSVMFGFILLLVVAWAGLADTGVGITAAYPMYFTPVVSDYDFEPSLIFGGVTLRWKPSALLVDVGLSFAYHGMLSSSFLNVGACFDLLILRVGLAAGLYLAGICDPDEGSYTVGGLDAKVNLDVKLGRISVGVSALVPPDVLLDLFSFYYDVEDDIRIVAGQAAVTVIYWFQSGPRSNLR
jgi:hypothetical protein